MFSWGATKFKKSLIPLYVLSSGVKNTFQSQYQLPTSCTHCIYFQFAFLGGASKFKKFLFFVPPYVLSSGVKNTFPSQYQLPSSCTCYIHFRFVFLGSFRNFYHFFSLQAFHTGLNLSENISPLTNTLPTSCTCLIHFWFAFSGVSGIFITFFFTGFSYRVKCFGKHVPSKNFLPSLPKLFHIPSQNFLPSLPNFFMFPPNMMMDSMLKLEMRGVLKMMYLWRHQEMVVEKHEMVHYPDCGNPIECRHKVEEQKV